MKSLWAMEILKIINNAEMVWGSYVCIDKKWIVRHRRVHVDWERGRKGDCL